MIQKFYFTLSTTLPSPPCLSLRLINGDRQCNKMLLSFTSLCTIRSEAITNRIILIWIKSLSSLSKSNLYFMMSDKRHFLKKWIKDDLWASKDNSIIGYWRIVNISNILSKAFRSNFTFIYLQRQRKNSKIPVYTKPCRKMFEKARCAKHVTQNAIRNQHFLLKTPYPLFSYAFLGRRLQWTNLKKVTSTTSNFFNW